MAVQVQFLESEIHRNIPARFRKVVAQTPDQLAVSTPDGEISFRDLDVLSDRIALQIAAVGLPDKEIVAIFLEQDINALASILGVLKAGKGYVLLPPFLPTAQIQAYLDDANQPIILTDSSGVQLISGYAARDHIINLDHPDLEHDRKIDTLDSSKPEDMAAIFYTSGSTGEPKGVIWSHQLVLHTAWINQQHYQISTRDRVAMMAAYGFGAAMTMSFATLLSGAALFLPPSRQRDALGLINWIKENGITILAMPEISFFRQIMQAVPNPELLANIRLVILGGGDLYKQDVELFRARFRSGAQVAYRLAGSETMLMREWLIDSDDLLPPGKLPVGYPVQDKELLLLSENREPVTQGQIGEIAIRSRYLASGYWHKPELTASSFLEKDSETCLRIYLTGDLGRLNAEGQLEFLGRKDNMVKIRGFSVQLEAIDQALMNLEGISRAATAVKTNQRGKQLVAYMIPDREMERTIPEIRQELENTLPSHMLPTIFQWIDELPLTPTGKVDRAQLPQPTNTRPILASAFRSASNDLEAQLVGIWESVLGVEQVGVDDGFFDLGGDSLTVLEMGLICEQKFLKALPQAFFRNPTIANLAVLFQFSGSQPDPSAGMFRLASRVGDEEEEDSNPRLTDSAANSSREKRRTMKFMKIGRYYRIIEKLVARQIVSLPYLDAQRWIINWSGNPLTQKLFYRQRELTFNEWLKVVFPDGPNEKIKFRMNLLNNLFFQLPKAVKKSEKNSVDRFEVLRRSNYPFWKTMADLIAETPLDELDAYFPIKDLAYLTRALEQRRGAILLSYHGTPRVTQFFTLSKRIGLASIPTISYQIPQRLSNVSSGKTDLTREEIFSLNAEIALYGQKVLAEGGVVHFASDTNDTVGRVYNVTIAGRIYQIKAGFAELALNTGAPIIPLTRYILPDGREQLEFFPPFQVEPGGREDQVEKLIHMYADFIQNCWQEHPEANSWARIQRHLRRDSYLPL